MFPASGSAAPMRTWCLPITTRKTTKPNLAAPPLNTAGSLRPGSLMRPGWRCRSVGCCRRDAKRQQPRWRIFSPAALMLTWCRLPAHWHGETTPAPQRWCRRTQSTKQSPGCARSLTAKSAPGSRSRIPRAFSDRYLSTPVSARNTGSWPSASWQPRKSLPRGCASLIR